MIDLTRGGLIHYILYFDPNHFAVEPGFFYVNIGNCSHSAYPELKFKIFIRTNICQDFISIMEYMTGFPKTNAVGLAC